jgi:uncharacterized membrane protein
MAALLALLSATAYGVGDFFGGLSARRLPSAAVVLRTHAAGLLGLLAVVPLVGGAAGHDDLAIGAAGGVAGALGVLAFYRAMASGVMSLVAPVTAVTAAVVPVAYGLATGERPSPVGMIGIPLALLAVALLSREGGSRTASGLSVQQLVTALGAGAGFGLYFVALGMASDDAGLWPVVAGRLASVTLFLLVTLFRPTARVGDRRARQLGLMAMLVACGLLDAWANALFLLATQNGMLTLVAVLGALYPAATLMLARTVLGERLARHQLAGVALAAAAVALVSIG